MKFTYSIPTKILFGPGSFNDLATTPLPGKKALVVITAGKSMRANGYLDRLIDMLDKQGIGHALFDKILPNPVLRHVHEGAALAREQGCDFVIGLGGGSSIDSAKSIAVMAKNPGDYWDYISGGSGKGQPLVNGALPIVAIATTAGTGTEADPWTVITKEDTNEKIGFGCAETFPVLSVVDPEMMLTIPAHSMPCSDVQQEVDSTMPESVLASATCVRASRSDPSFTAAGRYLARSSMLFSA